MRFALALPRRSDTTFGCTPCDSISVAWDDVDQGCGPADPLATAATLTTGCRQGMVQRMQGLGLSRPPLNALMSLLQCTVATEWPSRGYPNP